MNDEIKAAFAALTDEEWAQVAGILPMPAKPTPRQIRYLELREEQEYEVADDPRGQTE